MNRAAGESPESPAGASLYLLKGPRDEIWGLHPLSAEHESWLVGWGLLDVPFDETRFASCLARAFCRSFAVTFVHPYTETPITDRTWHRTADGWQVLLRPPGETQLPDWTAGLTDRLRSFAGFSRALPLFSTSRPEAALPLFDSRIWDLGGQIVLLSEPGSPPALSFQQIHGLLARSPADAQGLAREPLQGLFLPGHDGGWIELSFRDSSMAVSWIDSLQEACSHEGLSLEEVSEPVFREKLRQPA